MIDQLIQLVTDHPEEIVIWTHGFGWALALRRGRIKTILDRVMPDDEDGSDSD